MWKWIKTTSKIYLILLVLTGGIFEVFGGVLMMILVLLLTWD